MTQKCGILLLLLLNLSTPAIAQLSIGQGIMAGEVTQNSAILQSRLTKGTQLVKNDLKGQSGWAQFEISTSPDFADAINTGWRETFAQDDYIIKAQVDLLMSDTQYYYRLIYGHNTQNTKRSKTGTFRTLPKAEITKPMRFVVVTGMSYHQFYKGEKAYRGPDKSQGYPAFGTIKELKPNYFIGAGGNVYYDHPSKPATETAAQMREKWHQQFSQPRLIALLNDVPTYWLKDDHDYRFDDADPADDRLPTHDTGVAIFKEQVPVITPGQKSAPTYRTYRFGKLVQIWFTESRDYRSPNKMPDGPQKSLWGTEQKEWLKRTLSESDAPIKILVSPTPLIGPDINLKSDNHTNIEGFRYEGDGFFTWLYRNDFIYKNFYIVCGDRLWQYHSVHPTGFEEFSVGALTDANAKPTIKPGHHLSTDPNRLILQKHSNEEPTGGFLMIDVVPNNKSGAKAHFVFYDELGTELYRDTKTASP